jgi:hypothetical protein
MGSKGPDHNMLRQYSMQISGKNRAGVPLVTGLILKMPKRSQRVPSDVSGMPGEGKWPQLLRS